MSVKVRTKEVSGGRISLYLDYFPPVKGKKGKPTRREFLKRYNFKKPQNEVEKRVNRENMFFAETIRLQREKEILNEIDGLYNSASKGVDFLEYFQEVIERRMQTDSNYNNWMSAKKYVEAFTDGKCTMGDINEDFCIRFREYLLTTKRLNAVSNLRLSQNSAVSYYNKFRCVVKDAFADRYLTHNVLSRVKSIPAKESKREFLTLEELQKLAQTHFDLGDMKNASLFSALTGLRWSDVSNLKWADIQRTESGYFIHIIQQKTKDVMLHPISDKAFSLLGKKGKPDEKVFKDLVYSDRNNVRLRQWLADAGIGKRISFHNFRHTYATLLLNNGTDIYTVSKMLGHKNIQTTMIYSKILTETKVKAANVIDIEL